MKTAKEKTSIARKSKRKGKRGEKNAAIMLSLWWTGEEGNFVSTPGSGSLRWKKGVAKVSADLVNVGSDLYPEFPYSVEVKNRESWDLESMLKGGQKFWEWWKQTCDDSQRSNKKPMLMFTKNYSPYYIALSWMESFDATLPDCLIKLTDPESKQICIIMLADEFFKLNVPTHLKKKDPLLELLKRFSS